MVAIHFSFLARVLNFFIHKSFKSWQIGLKKFPRGILEFSWTIRLLWFYRGDRQWYKPTEFLNFGQAFQDFFYRYSAWKNTISHNPIPAWLRQAYGISTISGIRYFHFRKQIPESIIVSVNRANFRDYFTIWILTGFTTSSQRRV